MSIIRKRSSRPSPRSPRIVSLRPPSRINAPNAVMIPRDSTPLPGSPPIHCAANTTNPSATANSGTNHLDLATLIEHRLNRGLEESRQRQRERQRWRVAILLDRVDRLTRDPHLRGQLPLREPALAPQLPHRIAHAPRCAYASDRWRDRGQQQAVLRLPSDATSAAGITTAVHSGSHRCSTIA